MIVTLAGHVDHGKTAVVQALTGVNTDRLKEEQARGLTIDLGFAYTTTDGQRLGFVDVPGHHRFIHNMIAGVANQQHALLVVAADDGVMPQTIEHAQILRLLGIRSGTIVLNKVDLVSQSRMRDCYAELAKFQHDHFLTSARVFEVVAPQGEGIDALRAHLVQTAEQFDTSLSDRPFRLAIDRSFSLQGVGTIVTGTVTSGAIAVGDEAHLTNANERIRVRSLNVQGQDAESARAGDRCSLNIAGPNANAAERGDWLLSPNHVMPVESVTVELSILSDFPRQIRHWASVHAYHLTDHSEARLALLEGNAAKPSESTLAELHCDRPMHFKVGDRLILRDRDLSRTLGGALVLTMTQKASNRRRAKSKLPLIHAVRSAVENEDYAKVLEIQTSQELINVDLFQRFVLCTHNAIKPVLLSDAVVTTREFAMNRDLFTRIASDVQKTLREFHTAQPTQTGLSFEQLASRLTTQANALQFTLDRLLAEKLLRRVAGQYALAEHEATGPSYDTDLFEQVVSAFDAVQPVSLGDVAKRLRKPFSEIEVALRPMVAAKALLQINKNRYLTPQRATQLQDVAKRFAKRLAAVRPFSVREFRDASGLGRNTAIDVLEYFDRQRITQRQGDTRIVLSEISSQQAS